jgi:hypothetical protein
MAGEDMHTTKSTRTVRTALVVIGFVTLIVAAGFALGRSPFAEMWPLGDVVDRFLGAYLAGIGASLLWIGLSGDLRAAVAGAISLTIIYAGLAITWFTLSLGKPPVLRPAALVCVLAALVSAGLALWFRRFHMQDAQPLPRLVYGSYIGFAWLLAFVGVALLMGIPDIFFATLTPAAAALIGWCFLGSTIYFLYSLRFPRWRNACSQLWGFLAYDLALIVPLASRLGAVDAAHRPALVMNIAVLVFSGALAIYFLLIAPATRVWELRPAQANRRTEPLSEPVKSVAAGARMTRAAVRAARSGE